MITPQNLNKKKHVCFLLQKVLLLCALMNKTPFSKQMLAFIALI